MCYSSVKMQIFLSLKSCLQSPISDSNLFPRQRGTMDMYIIRARDNTKRANNPQLLHVTRGSTAVGSIHVRSVSQFRIPSVRVWGCARRAERRQPNPPACWLHIGKSEPKVLSLPDSHLIVTLESEARLTRGGGAHKQLLLASSVRQAPLLLQPPSPFSVLAKQACIVQVINKARRVVSCAVQWCTQLLQFPSVDSRSGLRRWERS